MPKSEGLLGAPSQIKVSSPYRQPEASVEHKHSSCMYPCNLHHFVPVGIQTNNRVLVTGGHIRHQRRPP